MTIYLVRHGEASARWTESDDPGLSARGQEQAAATAQELLQRLEPDIRLLSSPMRRARETARPLAEALGAEAVIVEPFREIPTPVELADRQTWLNRIARQSWTEQEEMVRAWRTGLLAELRRIDRPAVVFTHFMVLNAIVGALQETDRVVCFLPDNASVTTLRGFGENCRLLALGRELRTRVN